MSELSHLDREGAARMVDVGDKPATSRRAVATGEVGLAPATVELIRAAALKKGDVLAVSRLAGIMGGTRTAELIPLCHPLALTHLDVDATVHDGGVLLRAEARCTGPTGVEMEALTAVSIAALTVYDMVKAVDRSATIGPIRLVEKSGGKTPHGPTDSR